MVLPDHVHSHSWQLLHVAYSVWEVNVYSIFMSPYRTTPPVFVLFSYNHNGLWSSQYSAYGILTCTLYACSPSQHLLKDNSSKPQMQAGYCANLTISNRLPRYTQYLLKDNSPKLHHRLTSCATLTISNRSPGYSQYLLQDNSPELHYRPTSCANHTIWNRSPGYIRHLLQDNNPKQHYRGT